jgi:low temperature requirement protein LtrA
MESGTSTPPFSHTISHMPTHHASVSAQGATSGTNIDSSLTHVDSNTKKFRRPDGKIVHVAGSPDEERKLRKRLTWQSSMPSPQLEKSEYDSQGAIGDNGLGPLTETGDWDIVIHGSPEHIEALKETHQQAEALRDELKSKYGSDWEHMEGVVRELDRLNYELHMVSQHSVRLDANFSKYGYGAHIRTLPAGEENSTAVSTSGDMHDHDWDAAKNQGNHIQFYRTPVIRQYFHKGVLWRASDAYEPTTYEVFLDLLYVGIIAIAGDTAAEGASGHSLLVFVIAFTVTWKLWQDVQLFSSWISMDDVVRRLSSMFMMAILLGITINIAGSYEETYVPLIAFYIFGRFYVAIYFVWMGYLMPIVRNSMFGSAVSSAIPPVLWLASIWVPQPGRQALIWVALFLDIFGPVILVAFERGVESIMPKWLLEWCHRTFEFMPGNNIEHRIERTNSFVGLVFGYSIVALLYQSRVAMPINGFYGKAVLALVQSFCFNWIYFEIDTFNMHTHAIRRHFLTGKSVALIKLH